MAENQRRDGGAYYARILGEIREFLDLESASGIILLGAAALAVLASNSALAPFYDLFLSIPVEVRVGALAIDKPLLLWINDGLMAIFFLLVGLEIKRELVEGELSTPAQAVLPGVAALGGMVVPAAIYAGINADNPDALAGWAIPAATDIAFALGILQLVGRGVPVGLKVFLVALAIIDDLGAILIIAVFYTGNLSLLSLLIGGAVLAAMFGLNRLGVIRIAPYALLGIVLWVCVLKSGVHATLAGVAMAFAIPMRPPGNVGPSPLKHLEHVLHPWIAYLVMPLFAFANAGLSFAGLGLEALVDGVTLGIAAGLVLGKQIGAFGFAWAAIRLGLAKLPEGVRWTELYGGCLLAGVGFTMSLFIGTLAWDHSDFSAQVRLGVLAGSIVSGIAGFLLLRAAVNGRRRTTQSA